QSRDKSNQLAIGTFPVNPRELVVLTVRIVVAALGAAQLVAVDDQRRPLRQDQRRERVAFLLPPSGQDRLVVGWSFGAEVPGTVVAFAVAVVFPVGVVVLLVVRHQVVQREAIVGRDDVDAGARQPTVGEQIGTARDPGREVGEAVWLRP